MDSTKFFLKLGLNFHLQSQSLRNNIDLETVLQEYTIQNEELEEGFNSL